MSDTKETKAEEKDQEEQQSRTEISIKRKQNPLYKTSNSAYGAKPHNDYTKPDKWKGIDGSFTKGFVGGMYSDNSLNVSKTKSKAVKDPSFGNNSGVYQSEI
eukprot:gb/GECH01012258.1/.p1 GENE.gb/GECH01012258.1/~~gb/GECH01012258.1/.p1  ORF type:complete len:102 (+),score=28.36 gb/GECH01012258.1/:1-306(+)